MQRLWNLYYQFLSLQAKLEQTKKDLEIARAKEKKQYETLKVRIKVMYEKGETGLFDFREKQ